ncbi:MAG: serine/threonine protein kinase, partial [Oscillospiraceae bacterium]
HQKKIIHRDISPDNIILTEKRGPVLIDFGASRQYETEKSLSVILKYGYAPYEQYSRHGEQGPWTDIYALSATFYRMITGKKPPDPIVRIQESAEPAPLSELCGDIPPACEAAIMKGLSVRREDRLQSMDELYDILYGSRGKNGKNRLLWAVCPAAVLLIAGALAVYNTSDRNTADEASVYTAAETSVYTAAEDTEPYIPAVMYGLPSSEDEPYIRGRLPVDLNNTDKAAADDPEELYRSEPHYAPMATVGSLENRGDYAIVFAAPGITSFSGYVQAHGMDFESDKPVYSYIEEDMDGDGECEYIICAALPLDTSETAFLLYYKEDDGSIELICIGKLPEGVQNCESIFKCDAEIFYRSGEKCLTADISGDNSRYIILNGNGFSLIDA